MATINASTSEKVVSVKKWLGLNQCADGDTMLNVGEASVMKNFKVTRDGTLKRRPGMTKIYGVASTYSIEISEEEVAMLHPRGTAMYTVYGGYSLNVQTGKITGTDSQGKLDSGAVKTLLQNAEVGEHYYYFSDTSVYQLTRVTQAGGSGGGSSGRTATYTWYGYEMTSESSAEGTESPVWLWSGYVGGHEQIVCACEGRVYALWDYTNDELYSTKFLIGYIYETRGSGQQAVEIWPENVCFFPFSNKLYILTNLEYYVWDGTHVAPATPPAYTSYFTRVYGYAPLIATSLEPNTTVSNVDTPGSYELLEPINRVSPWRRVWLSPDGSSHKKFTLPEEDVSDIISVTKTSDGSRYEELTDYTFSGNVVTFTDHAQLQEGVNSIEIEYCFDTSEENYIAMRNQIITNTQYELYSGKTDTVIFLYGNGTNKCVYSGMDYDGQPRADYFPDLNDIAIGDENTPITQMIRHNAALIAFKKDSAWAIQQDIITLADGSQTFGYYVTPVNKAVGNEALGQVQLVDNDPITLFNKNIYRWVNSSYYSSNLTRDERQARVISDRVHTICDELDFENVMMWDDNDHQELYISNKLNKSLVWNYGKDVWYEYDIGPYAFINFHGTLYFCAGAGFLYEFDEDAESDDGEPIKAEWVSGAMDFGVDYSRKYSSMLWVGLKAEEGTSVDVTVRTDRKDTFKEKVVPSTKAKVAGEPFMVKTKIKAKKFIYYRLILESNEIAPPVTVTTADIRVRMTGYAK